jgi:uncharacterized protein (DUF1501 family)
MIPHPCSCEVASAPHPSIRGGVGSRRGFLRQLIFGQLPVVENPGARTLVCIFLRGGADTLNMLVPVGDGDYYRNRPTLAIAAPNNGAKQNADAAIRIDDFYGFHPKMSPLESIYKEGRLGFVQAVGSDNTSGSHFEAQDQIEHGESYGKNIGGGWLGRHLRSRAGGNDSPLAGIAIGPTLPESLRGAPAASALHSLDELQLPVSSGDPKAVSRALSKLYEAEVGIIGRQGKETLDLLRRVEQLRGREYKPLAGADYPQDSFGAGLREIARITKANLGLEVACIDLGGWDTHFLQGTQLGGQAELIDRLSRGLAAFDADLKGHHNRVTTVVMTEFGRRLYENGSAGTDHGRGFALMALGGRINGGKVHGAWPGLKEEPSLPGPGGMEVKIDYRSVLSEILEHAIGNAKIKEVFPGFEPKKVGITGEMLNAER